MLIEAMFKHTPPLSTFYRLNTESPGEVLVFGNCRNESSKATTPHKTPAGVFIYEISGPLFFGATRLGHS